jgi:23S rRNA pseudouridine2457 synthase
MPHDQTRSYRTFALFKPYDVLCQFTDAAGRSTLKDYVAERGVYPVGRLDRDSEGLLLLSDDGNLAHRLTDPSFEHPRTYLVQVERVPLPSALAALRRGIVLSDGLTRPAEVELLEEPPELPDRPVPIRFRKNVPTSWLRLTLREGRNRQVRRMTAAVGHPTLRLLRTAIGPIELGDLAPGQCRELTAEERAAIEQLRAGHPDQTNRPRRLSHQPRRLSRRPRRPRSSV